ncbi:MAG: hypothetical protein LBJ97_02720 [Mycoplasmataceae bacterium]|nr:hypothetical protein [Mycoplasmataceae bacterium]
MDSNVTARWVSPKSAKLESPVAIAFHLFQNSVGKSELLSTKLWIADVTIPTDDVFKRCNSSQAPESYIDQNLILYKYSIKYIIALMLLSSKSVIPIVALASSLPLKLSLNAYSTNPSASFCLWFHGWGCPFS